MASILSQEQRHALSQKAAELALQAANGVLGAAEKCREIVHKLAMDRQLVIGE
jgi:hypothetical protein